MGTRFHLILCDLWYLLKPHTKSFRAHLYTPTAFCGEFKGILAPAVDRAKTKMRPSACTLTVGDRHDIRNLVANERQGEVEEIGDQHLAAWDARRHRLVIRVDNLHNDNISEDVDSARI